MADIATRLRIRYGLRNDPSDEQIRLWVQRARENSAIGLSREGAGESAARATFPDFNSYALKTEADTIEALLAEAAKK